MEVSLPYLALSLSFLVIAFKLLLKQLGRRNLPPSPRALPIIGHLHLLKHPIHRTLQSLSQDLGSVFSLRFGSRLVVVVSSPSAVEECFTKNDIVLANRPSLTATKYFGYNGTTVISAPYGDHWRNLRRLISLELLSNNRLNSFSSIRRDEINLLLRRLYKKSSRDFSRVEMKSKLSELTLNNIVRMIAGKRYYGEDLLDNEEEEAREFREIVSEIFKYGGASNPSDFVPILRWIDYRSFEKNLKVVFKKMDGILQGLIEEHRVDRSKNSMIDHLLSLQESQPEYYTDTIIRGLILVSRISSPWAWKEVGLTF